MRAYEDTTLIIDHVERSGYYYLDITYNGNNYTRQIYTDAYPYFKSWKVLRGCQLTDVLSGHKVNSKGWKSEGGSIKHASEDLVKLLIGNGIII